MNKKLIVVLFVSLFLFTLVSAGRCNPDSGYDICKDAETSQSYGSCTAEVNPKVMVNSNLQVENGELQRPSWTYYVTGPSYIKYNFDSKYGLIYENKDWEYIWNHYDCSKNGCSFSNYEEGKNLKEGRYYLTREVGDRYDKDPSFVTMGHELSEKSSCYAWAGAGNGWSGGTFTVEQVECLNGKDKCIGDDYYKCEDHSWKNKGKTAGECGIECTENSDCPEDEKLREECDTNDDVLEIFETYSCQNYDCVSSEKEENLGKIIGECGVECKSDSDCREDAIINNSEFCLDKDTVSLKMKNYSCMDNKCDFEKENTVKKDCDYRCSSGECVSFFEQNWWIIPIVIGGLISFLIFRYFENIKRFVFKS